MQYHMRQFLPEIPAGSARLFTVVAMVDLSNPTLGAVNEHHPVCSFRKIDEFRASDSQAATRACHQLSQTTPATSWTAARKFRAVFS